MTKLRGLLVLLVTVTLVATCGKSKPGKNTGPGKDPSQEIRPGETTIPGGQAPGKGQVPPVVDRAAPPLPLQQARARYTSFASAQSSFASLPAHLSRSAATVRPPDEKTAADEAPLSLTATDGTGLKLVGMNGKAVIQGPVAFTELHLTFQNPSDRVIEGHFSITLPQNAAVSRFAMKINDRWQEAEVVELQRARVIYEDFLHRKQDPALLEKRAGNAFSARVFPIPASGRKELIVSYSHELPTATSPYLLPLKGLPEVEALEISAMLGTVAAAGQPVSTLGGQALIQQVIKVSKTKWKPDQDFLVQPQGDVRGLRHENLIVARVKPAVQDAPVRISSLLVLFDTSASRAAGFLGSTRRLGELIAELRKTHGDGFSLKVAAFDQVIDLVHDGKAGDFGDAQVQKLLARRALGASDLHGALSWAATQKGFDRVLLVSDGVATAGMVEGDAIRAAALRLKPAVKRLDVLASGGIRDDAVLGRLVRGALEQDGTVLEDLQVPAEQARRLGRTTVSGIGVQVAGAEWTWPTTIDGVQPGDEVLVYADVAEASLPAGKPIAIQLTGAAAGTHEVPLTAVPKPLLHRAWVKARMLKLQHQADTGAGGDPDLRAAIKQQIVNLSKQHRVLCDETALLVLETEWDYRRYGLERNALADILTVGASGVELLQRGGATPPLPPGIGITPRPPVRKFSGPTGSAMSARRSAPADSNLTDLLRQASSSDQGAGSSAGGRRAMRRAAPEPAAKAETAPARADSMMDSPSDGMMGDRPADRGPAEEPANRSAAARPRSSSALQGLFDDDPPPRMDRRARPPRQDRDERPARTDPYTGRMKTVKDLLAKKQVNAALVEALTWWTAEPGDVVALVALGEALEAAGEYPLAARVYGSIIDLYPQRADLRRFAGQRLEALGKHGQALAADTYAQAARQRADHPGSHRLLAFALLRLGHFDAALEAILVGLKGRYRQGSFAGVHEVMRHDASLIAAALVARQPQTRAQVEARLAAFEVPISQRPSLRFVLYWETDANDVDFHIFDGRKNHAFYQQLDLPTGGRLFADVTTGYGPECFAIPGKPAAYPYRLQIHYYSRGPMGYGMGKLEAIEHDGKGNLAFKQIPYLVMNDGAFVDLGTIKGSLF